MYLIKKYNRIWAVAIAHAFNNGVAGVIGAYLNLQKDILYYVLAV